MGDKWARYPSMVPLDAECAVCEGKCETTINYRGPFKTMESDGRRTYLCYACAGTGLNPMPLSDLG